MVFQQSLSEPLRMDEMAETYITQERLDQFLSLQQFFPEANTHRLFDFILELGINRLMEQLIDDHSTRMVPHGAWDGMVLSPEGSTYTRKPAHTPFYTLEEMQECIRGGYIERVSLSPTWMMLVDEDGINKGLAYNDEATKIAGQTILGSVLICVSARML